MILSELDFNRSLNISHWRWVSKAWRERGLDNDEGWLQFTYIVLHPPVADPGATDDERRTVAEMMAKGTYATIAALVKKAMT